MLSLFLRCALSAKRESSPVLLSFSHRCVFTFFLLLVSTALTNPFLTNIAVKFRLFLSLFYWFMCSRWHFLIRTSLSLQFKASAICESGYKEHFLFVCVCRVRSGYRKQRLNSFGKFVSGVLGWGIYEICTYLLCIWISLYDSVIPYIRFQNKHKGNVPSPLFIPIRCFSFILCRKKQFTNSWQNS